MIVTFFALKSAKFVSIPVYIYIYIYMYCMRKLFRFDNDVKLVFLAFEYSRNLISII